MYKYKKPLSGENIQKLKSFSSKDFSKYTEADIREEFIAPLLDMLGYEKNTDYEVEREESFKTSEMYLNIGRQRIELDYIFNIRKKNFWLIEAKSGKNRQITQDDIQQAYLYSLHQKINARYFVVTNGWYLNLYDRNKYLADSNADIFTPVLSLQHNNLEENFEKLYYKLGASNIQFNIKIDCLLNEIEKTLSSEVYTRRLEQFDIQVKRIIKKSEQEVYKNIRAIKEVSEKKQSDDFKDYLSSCELDSLVDIVFRDYLNNYRFEIAYTVIKDKFLKLNDCFNCDGYSALDSFFNKLFISKPRSVNLVYFSNIIVFLLRIQHDVDLKGLHCNYSNNRIKRIPVSEITNKYLLDLFNFFPNNIASKVVITSFPLIYRLAKIFVYYLPNEKNKAIQRIASLEYHLTEEELSNLYLSKGGEMVTIALDYAHIMMNDFLNKVFDKNNKFKPSIYEQEIKKMEDLVNNLSNNTNFEKFKKELPSDEQDEIGAADSSYKQPWESLFIFTSNVLNERNYKYSQELIEKIDLLKKIGFMTGQFTENEAYIKITTSLKYSPDKHIELQNETSQH